MQSVDQDTNEEEDQQKLPSDFDKPFSPPSGTEDDPTVSTQDDPALDTGVSQQEWYDEGRTNAAGKKDMDETDSPVGGRKIA